MKNHFKWTLIASIVTNAILIGIVIGFLSGNLTRLAVHTPADTSLSDVQKKFREHLHHMRKEHAKYDREDEKNIRNETLRLLTASEFDASAYQAELEKMETLRAEKRRRMAEDITAFASTLSHEERKELAKIFRSKHERFRKP